MKLPIPIIAVVGFSNSGKTSLVCSLVTRLSGHGYSVAVAKHAPHGHDTGNEAVDSSRIANAGASRVAVVSPGQTSRFETLGSHREESLESLTNWATGCDLLLLEGWKSSVIPKIIVGDSDGTEFAPPVIATVKDGQNFTEDEFAELITKIEGRMGDQVKSKVGITVKIDGNELRLKRFPSAALVGVITGYLDTLEEVPPEWESLEIRIDGC